MVKTPSRPVMASSLPDTVSEVPMDVRGPRTPRTPHRYAFYRVICRHVILSCVIGRV